MKQYFEMVKVRPGLDKIISELFALAFKNDNLTRNELMRLALIRIGKSLSAGEAYMAADLVVRKVKKLLELNKLEESSSIMGSDYGAISIQQSPSEFGEIPSQAGVVSQRKEKKPHKKKIKFKRKIK